MKLNQHPRLYISQKDLARLKNQPETPFIRMSSQWVAENAEEWVKMPRLTFNPDTHNSLLVRAREVQERVLTLLVRWRQTGESRFRDAALAYIRIIGGWKCWSWITWRKGDCRPAAIYDLSYGENSATLSVAYDLLYDTLSSAEKRLFHDIALRWSFASGIVHCKPRAAWWFGRPDSNWNSVCAGGLGMLSLAMYDEIPIVRQILPRVERSIASFMNHLDRTSGAWPEGIGYWNYGMRYAFMYLLSRENATGQRHPLMQLKGTYKTLEFPLDFTPNGQPCSFGDANRWTPLPFHYAAARRLRNDSVMQRMDTILRKKPEAACGGNWASAAEWLLFHDGRLKSMRPMEKRTGARLYRGVDWAVVADRWPEPGLYVSVRGGTTKVPHGHCDLFSFNIVVKGEKLISSEGNSEYLDTTFSPRRYDLPDINAQYKNTIMINGVGVPYGASLKSTRIFNHTGISGVHLEGAGVMGTSRDSESTPEFCARLVLLLKNQAFLVVDRVVTLHPARVESRLHTHAEVHSLSSKGACLRGRSEKMRLAFAASVPCLLARSMTAPINPSSEPAQMLRWCTEGLHKDVVLAAAAVPGTASAGITIVKEKGVITVDVRFHKKTVKVELSEKLKFLRVV
jgi:hypothetical protein